MFTPIIYQIVHARSNGRNLFFIINVGKLKANIGVFWNTLMFYGNKAKGLLIVFYLSVYVYYRFTHLFGFGADVKLLPCRRISLTIRSEERRVGKECTA